VTAVVRILALVALLFGAGSALAVEPGEVLKDPVLEARARAISADLRCLVCQNQSIDDSNADLAHDLRVLVRERLTAGDTDQQAIDYLVARYGEFILLQPQFNAHTLVLWLAPPAVLIFGIGLAVAVYRRRGAAVKPLSPDEEAALGRALSDR
jgi:cytochrome c-type biogenesis protein CcmH